MRRFLLMLLVIFMVISGCATTHKKRVETVFYPSLPQRPRIQFLTSITSEEDIGKGRSALGEFITGRKEALRRLSRPYDVASSKGKIYVTDRDYKKIIVIDLAKDSFDFMKDKRGGTLSNPIGIWVTKEGEKYVADMGRKQIVRFDSQDKYVRSYGNKEIFTRPLDVAVYKENVYAVDLMKNHIVVFEKKSGKVKKIIGKVGQEKGLFRKPSHITVDEKGNIYVNDSFNFRVQKFDRDGKYIETYGYPGDTLGGFARPKGLVIDREGHLYVVDIAFENVQIFDDKSTKLLLFFGGFGPSPGSMYLPAGIHIDYENIDYFEKYADKDFKIKYLIYVGNMSGAHKVNVYGFGDWTGEELPEMGTPPSQEKKKGEASSGDDSGSKK